jgi:hypothetical protein
MRDVRLKAIIALAMILTVGLVVNIMAEKQTPEQASAVEAKMRLPWLTQQMSISETFERGWIAMDTPKLLSGGLWYVSVCRATELKAAGYLKPDGSLPENWKGVNGLTGEKIAFATWAGAPCQKGAKVLVQFASYPSNNSMTGAPNNSHICVIVGSDE